MERHNKIIGILGGMGPEAGCILHQYINRAARKILKTKRDEDYPNVIHFSLPKNIADRTDFLLGMTDENPAQAVIPMAKELSRIGQAMESKVVACVACNAFHTKSIWDYFCNQLKPLENLSFINLVDVAVENIKDNVPKNTKIAIFSTIGGNKEGLYESRLGPLNYEIVPLSPQQQQDMHRIIYDHEYGIKANSVCTERACNLLLTVVQSLKEKDVNKIILGCTELSIAFSTQNDELFIDPMKIAAERLVYSSIE